MHGNRGHIEATSQQIDYVQLLVVTSLPEELEVVGGEHHKPEDENIKTQDHQYCFKTETMQCNVTLQVL